MLQSVAPRLVVPGNGSPKYGRPFAPKSCEIEFGVVSGVASSQT
jgi:hypothetical protein